MNSKLNKEKETRDQVELEPLFDSLDKEKNGKVSLETLLEYLQVQGIQRDDPRLKYFFKENTKKEFFFDEFIEFFTKGSTGIVRKALLQKLSIPDFKAFREDIDAIYHRTKNISEGEPGIKKNKAHFAISICTIDGQQLRLGNHHEKFPLQSVSKAINYAIALSEVGEDKVHKHVGREPSGRGFNGLVLNQDNLPHNPMINAGAIMTCSLIMPELDMKKREGHIKETWSRLCGNSKIGFNQGVFKAEGEASRRNMALSYYMLEQNAFPEKTDIYKTIELYNKCCALELDIDQLSLAAASLANGGICPMTNDKIFGSDDVRDCLSLMISCGMYDYSGEFAFLVGLPAKSGVSGAMMVVVPGLMGIGIYSPPLDGMGNPVRGVEFCKELVERYSFHIFDHIVDYGSQKKDPRQLQLPLAVEGHTLLLYAASQGDLIEVQSLSVKGVSLEEANVDKRTALHLSAAEGRYSVVEYLLKNKVHPNPRDRWGRTPLTDAVFGDHTKTAGLIKKYGGTE